MDIDKYYKSMFLIAGIWNLAVGVIFILFYPILFPLMGITMPISPMWIQLALLLVIVFGIGYIFAALDPEGNKGIVRIGAIGKIIVFCLFTWYATHGEPLIIISFAIVDLIFGLLFVEFIVRY